MSPVVHPEMKMRESYRSSGAARHRRYTQVDRLKTLLYGGMVILIIWVLCTVSTHYPIPKSNYAHPALTKQ